MKLKLGTKNFSKIFNNLLKNQVVLYLVALLALYCVVQYTMKNNLAAIGLFLAIGYGATHFTKNMIIVLLSSIIITKVLINCGLFKTLGIREGFDEKDDENKNKKANDKSDDESDDDSTEGDKKRQSKSNSNTNSKSKNEDKSKLKPSKDISETLEILKIQEKLAKDDQSNVSGKPETTSKKNTTSGFSNLNDDPDLTGSGAKVDYAGTVERAFDNLEKILGSDGIKKMSDDTARLAEKQESLVNAMKNMQPLMDNAQKMLKTIEGTPFAGMIGATGLLGDKKNE